MNPARIRHGRRAIALAELIVCIGIIALIISMTSVCFAQMIRLRGAQERYDAHRATADFLLRRIAHDVRPGQALLARHGEATAGDKTLIIRQAKSVIVYRVTPDGVERVVVSGGKRETQLLARTDGMTVRFAPDAPAAEARSVVTNIAWTEPPKIGLSSPTLSLRTALRNAGGEGAP